MDHLNKAFARMGVQALFIVWGAPQGSHRSKLIGEQLGIDVHHICFTAKQGWFTAPVKYFFQMLMTLVFLIRHRTGSEHAHELIFVQDPPIFAVLPVYVYSLFSEAHFIIDSHTDALQAAFWKWTLPLHRFLERRAVTTIVTNDKLREMIEGWGAHAFTLEDPPAQFNISQPTILPDSTLNVVVVSTADYDEPVQEIVEAARRLEDVDFYITGDFANSRKHQGIVENAPGNVHFTGYVREGYFALLDATDVIMCLTTEDNTFLSGANEALWLGKPIITSDWPLLRAYFNKGTIHVDNTVADIRHAVQEMKDNLADFQAGIRSLQKDRYKDWWKRADDLVHIIQNAM
jgi:glycosyltransferase involved in cell wall biosynthesis